MVGQKSAYYYGNHYYMNCTEAAQA